MSRSLSRRLVLGAALWTVGLFGVMVVLHNEIMAGNPGLPRHLTKVLVLHSPQLAAIALVFLILGFVQVRRGISGVQELRRAITALRTGERRRLEGVYPSEVQPLVDDLNALLEHRERTVARALGKAGDLAHGLKTPLAVLAREAAHAREAGLGDLSATLSEEIERMRRQVDYHLAQARAAASGVAPGARCSVTEAADALVRTMLRLHAERGLSIHVSVPPDLAFRGQREDLEEMLGNVLDNACKWARTQVAVKGSAEGDRFQLVVEDDGAGLDASMCEKVLQRGVRADEAAPGTGLGLAIVRDLVELYGGAIALDRSALGGLRVTLTLPRAVPC